MQTENELRKVLLVATVTILIVVLLGGGLAAVVMLSADDAESVTLRPAVTNSPVAATAAPTDTTAPTAAAPTDTTAPTAAAPTDTTAPAAVAPTDTTAPAAAAPTAAPSPSASTIPPTAAATLTATPAAVPASPTLPPAPSPTQGAAARLYWPDHLPEGMALAVHDSWPFRVIAAGREQEAFLIFRGAEKWLLIRRAPEAPQALPRSATTTPLTIGGTSIPVVRYSDGGFKLLWARDGQTIQMSGSGITDADIVAVAEGLRPLDDEALRSRLAAAAAGQSLPLTLLWPSTLPPGMSLVPAETITQPAPGAAASVDQYRVSFRGPDSLLQIGGGALAPPVLAGMQEVLSSGSLRGVLTTADRRHLLVVDPGTSAAGGVLRFPEPAGSGALRLPLVQRGPVFIWAENLDRVQLEQIVGGLIPLRPEEFLARARGLQTHNLRYLWPDTLPGGFRLDLSSVRAGWDDFVLQGGLPYYELTAVSPDGGRALLSGGREAGGAAFIVPEGPGVERGTATIRSRVASIARTPEGATVVWSEDGVTYQLTSPTLQVEELVAIGEGLQLITVDEFFRRVQ